ncbi:MAG: hypothetical protein ACREEM_33555 [Blastocatellia bacterium]
MGEPQTASFNSEDQTHGIFAVDSASTGIGEGTCHSISALLKTTVEAGDEVAFHRLLETLDYSSLSAEDFILAIKAALEIGAYPASRSLSVKASNRFPAHAEIQKYAHVLAPPRVISSIPATKVSSETIKNNWNWLGTHGAAFRGKWVALRNGEFVGAADSLKDLTKELDDRKDVFLTIAY